VIGAGDPVDLLRQPARARHVGEHQRRGVDQHSRRRAARRAFGVQHRLGLRVELCQPLGQQSSKLRRVGPRLADQAAVDQHADARLRIGGRRGGFLVCAGGQAEPHGRSGERRLVLDLGARVGRPDQLAQAHREFQPFAAGAAGRRQLRRRAEAQGVQRQ
jgi:hypothetical protein